jgi:putative ABC transport system permease protein
MRTREIRPLISAFAFDLRHSLRSLTRNPSLSSTMLLVLTLGIAANTTIFSVMEEVILRPLPYRDPSQLVMAWERDPSLGEPASSRTPPSWKTLEQWKLRSHSFVGLEAFDRVSYNLTGRDRPLRVTAERATSGFFDLLGVDAQFGRLFLPIDATADRVAVLSNNFFRDHFRGPSEALGQTILLDGEPYEIVGVLPATFHLPAMWQGITEFKPDVWVVHPNPKSAPELEARNLLVFGHLRSGVSVEQANADLRDIARHLAEEDPKRDPARTANVFPLSVEDVFPAVRSGLYLLSAAAFFILLLACANLANLMVARNLERRKEIAIHLALGGTRMRLAGKAFAESLLLSLTAAFLGLVLARLGVKLIILLNPGMIHTPERIHLDAGSAFFALALCILTSILFGPVPAWLSTRGNFAQNLKDAGRGMRSHARPLFRLILLTGQVAASFFLTVVAVLTIRSFQKVLAVDPGFQPDGILTAHIVLPQARYSTHDQRVEFCSRLLSASQGLPGVKSVSLIDSMPLYDIKQTYFTIEGRPIAGRETPPVSDYANVAPSFFETLGIRDREGRLFAPQDFRDNPNVVVINETLAKRYWPGKNPVGEHIHRRISGADSPAWEIIGVTNDFAQYGRDYPPRPEMLLPAREMQEMTIVLKTGGDPLQLAPSLESTVWHIDKDQPIAKIETLSWKLMDSIAQRRFTMILLSVFAAIALGVSLIGTYGLLVFNISARERDFAIRRALGASRFQILRLLLGYLFAPLTAGILLGVLLARIVGRLLSALVFEVSISDSVVLVGISVLILALSVLVVAWPAWKASEIDPNRCLRHE